MKYMALIYSAPNAGPAYGTPEFEPYMAAFFAANAKYTEDGVMVSGEALVVSLRRMREPVTTIGPPSAVCAVLSSRKTVSSSSSSG